MLRQLLETYRIRGERVTIKFKQLPHESVLCNAKTRAGTPCKNHPLKGKTRCKLHGGMSTGAKTKEGRESISLANFKSGQYTKEAKEQRKMLSDFIRACRKLMEQVRG